MTGLLAILTGALCAYSIGSLEAYISYMFSLLISGVHCAVVPFLCELLYHEPFYSSRTVDVYRQFVLCRSRAATSADAHNVDDVDWLGAYIPVCVLDLFRCGDDHRIHA